MAQARTTENPTQRERVYEAAMNAIAELGPEGATMREIGARVQMSPGHILYYFGTKDRVLLETLQWSDRDQFRRERARVDRVRSNSAKLTRLVEGYLPRSSRDPHWLLWAHTFARPPRDQDGLDVIEAVGRQWFELLIDTLEAGVRAGEFVELDAEKVALRALVLMDGFALNVLLGVDPYGPEWAIRQVTDFLDDVTRPPTTRGG